MNTMHDQRHRTRQLSDLVRMRDKMVEMEYGPAYDGLAHITPKISIKKLSENAVIPTKADDGAAGWDLYAAEGPIETYAGHRVKIPTDIAIAIPEGFVGLIWPRSGLAVKKGVDVLAGVIDSSYRGNIVVCLLNTSNRDPVIIQKGDRIAQILFQEVPKFDLVEANELDKTERESGGFGDSGQ